MSARLRYCLGAVSRLLSGRFVYQPAQVFPRQVCVRHGGSKIGVAYRLLHQHSRFLIRQPCCDSSMPEVVLHELGRELGLFCGSLERTVSDRIRLPAL